MPLSSKKRGKCVWQIHSSSFFQKKKNTRVNTKTVLKHGNTKSLMLFLTFGSRSEEGKEEHNSGEKGKKMVFSLSPPCFLPLLFSFSILKTLLETRKTLLEKPRVWVSKCLFQKKAFGKDL